MAKQRGYKQFIQLDFETTFGQSPATKNGIRLPVYSSTLAAEQNMIEDTLIRGNRNPAAPSFGNITVTGQVAVPVDVVAFGYWLKTLLGAPTTTGTAGNYVHVFKNSGLQPSFLIEQAYPDVPDFALYNGCKSSKMSMSFGGDEELKANIDVMGAKETHNETAYDDTPTDIDIVKYNQATQLTIEEGGTTSSVVTKAGLDLDPGLDGDTWAIGSLGLRTDILEGVAKISGTVEAFFESMSLLNKAINSTESSLKLLLTSGAKSLEFLIPELVYKRSAAKIQERSKGVRIELPWEAYFGNSANATALQVTLKNDQASY